MRRRFIGKAYRIHVVIVSRNPVQSLACLNIVYCDGVGVRSGDKLPAVSGEPNGHDAETRRRGAAVRGWAAPEVKGVRITFVQRVRRRETDARRERGVREPFVVGAQRSIGQGPLSVGVVDRLVMPPYVRVGRVVQADSEVMAAGKKEVSIVRELPRVYR